MKTLLAVVGLFEAITGLSLLVAPSLVSHLLLGAGPEGVGIPVARVAGIALTAFGAGCLWGSVWLGMWLYTLLVGLFLLYVGTCTEWHGRLLWPAVAVHAVLTVVLAKYLLPGAAAPRPHADSVI